VEIVPAAVVEMVPAAVVEMVPLRVVEIVPPLENAVTDKVNVSNAAISDVDFRFRIILSWSTKGQGLDRLKEVACKPFSLGRSFIKAYVRPSSLQHMCQDQS
jgi:hypothetical protein